MFHAGWCGGYWQKKGELVFEVVSQGSSDCSSYVVSEFDAVHSVVTLAELCGQATKMQMYVFFEGGYHTHAHIYVYTPTFMYMYNIDSDI